jgi:hypothetical protein
VMNGNGMGATLKSAAERHGAHYVAIVPGWAQTERILRERGFPLEAEVAAAAPLTHRPLAAVGAPQQQELPAPVETLVALPARDATETPSELHKERAAEAAAPKPCNLTDEDRAKAAAVRSAKTAAKMVLAEELLRAAPALDLPELNKAIRAKLGSGLNGAELCSLRRRLLAELGLPPAPGTKACNRLAPAAPVLAEAIAAAPPPPPAAGDALPVTVRSAAQQLAAALIDAGLEGTLTVATDGALSFDLEQRRRLSGRASF